MEKDKLIRVYEKTVKDIKAGFYINTMGEEIKFISVDRMKHDSKMFNSVSPLSKSSLPVFPETKIYVQNIDTFQKALEFGPSGAVLNMASHRNPGGGVSKGSRAQEEELCRRSNLLLPLYAFSGLGSKVFYYTKRIGEYPIPKFGGIYCPYVNIYRKPGTYEVYDKPSITNVISVAAFNRPRLTEDNRLVKTFVKDIKEKIRTILRIAIMGKHSKLVLGAFGCGAFCNPPRHIAELFSEVFLEDEFIHSFEEICFAILDDGNTGKSHNPEGNFKPFKEVFGGYYK